MNDWDAKEVKKQQENPPDKFVELLELWDSWNIGKTDNPVKLTLKINSLYQAFTSTEKRQFTEFMISKNKFSEKVIQDIRSVKGVLIKLT